MAERVPELALVTGQKMPVVGFGTATLSMPSDQLVSIFLESIEAGYRHFDTALAYPTEQPLGRAIEEALQRGLIESRDELFITSKVWCTHAHRDLVLPSIKETLSNLGLEYLDLCLLHFPVRLKLKEISFVFDKEDIIPFEMGPTWEAMEECQRLGLTKSIGVSNFTCKKLTELLSIAQIPPVVNQVEFNVGWQQRKLTDFCKEKGIVICAWSPLGAYGTSWGTNAVLENGVLNQIAQARGKTTAQVALRWIYEQGVVIIVKSFNKERMRENLKIFDWELSEDDSRRICEIPQRRGYSGDSFVSPNGLFKTREEFWDGEI
ncbi:hypothetical protein QJS04_geneDACA017148 [Acorus gramineus]|uniref:NADP-dependent oxidoreductase domain-containing protein n=1 Tax=Acorus gramineus TaxID=55184 RepID=A0AAV9BMV2_ACOGR|nr:hypothetical protein QJS04_geneDACA017148 [Acorus gramineus]